MTDSELIIGQTQCWLRSVIIGHNYCPFAKRELDRNSIRYKVVADAAADACLHALIEECVHLDGNATTETTLLILVNACSEFDDYLIMLDFAEKLLIQQGYEGIYQLASFHPGYLFAGSKSDDAANYTNRSPYPMLHIIRESSIEKALQHYPEPECIPERNVEHARSLGLDAMKSQLDACRHGRKK